MFDMPAAMIVNSISHIVSVLSLSFFIILLFGRDNSIVHTWTTWRAMSLKLFVALLAGSHFVSIFNIQEIPVAEICLNIGLALIWSWAAVFHYQHFVKMNAFKGDGK